MSTPATMDVEHHAAPTSTFITAGRLAPVALASADRYALSGGSSVRRSRKLPAEEKIRTLL